MKGRNDMVRATPFGFAALVDAPIGETVERVTAALQAEGFGVLTTIDVADTMKQKLGVEMEPYVILGACNPALAHRGLQAEPGLGLLLPCNVTVREMHGRSEVVAVDPEAMLGVAGSNDAVKAVATEAAARLRRVAAALGGQAG
jgi:uncharacterized protein (DUF302 family)